MPYFWCGGAPPLRRQTPYGRMSRQAAIAVITAHYKGHDERLSEDVALIAQGRATEMAEVTDEQLDGWLDYLNQIISDGRDFRRGPPS